MKSLISLFPPLLIAGIVLQGCTEDPTVVGNRLVDSLQIPHMRFDTLVATSHTTKFVEMNTSATDRVLLGKYSSYDALALITFNGLSTSVLDSITITSATLQLHAVYHFGDSLAPLAFSVYKAIVNTDTTSYDSLTLQPANYYVTNPIGAFPPTVVDDTSIIQCQLDTAVVNGWFTPTGSLLNYGVILKASNVSMVKGFGSFYHATVYDRPTLVINYVRGTTPGTFFINTGTSRYVASIPKSSLTINPDLMYVQAGIAYRGELFFNLQNLPKAAQILRADLELTVDGADSKFNYYTADSLLSFYVNPDSTLSLVNYGQSLTDNMGRKFYRFPIRTYVRTWAATKVAQSVEISALGEMNSLDLFTLYGTLSAADVRPRLIITSTYILQ